MNGGNLRLQYLYLGMNSDTLASQGEMAVSKVRRSMTLDTMVMDNDEAYKKIKAQLI